MKDKYSLKTRILNSYLDNQNVVIKIEILHKIKEKTDKFSKNKEISSEN